MSQTQHTIIWGTGSLSDRFWSELADTSVISCFVDSNPGAEKRGLAVIPPTQLQEQQFDKLIICSSWVDEIVAQCFELGIGGSLIYIVQAKSLELVPLSSFIKIAGEKLYYLPWSEQLEDINRSHSSDIVQPDVYKTLAKSVTYCFVASVHGDFAEFGTCSGYTASLIAHSVAINARRLEKHEVAHDSKKRELCLFDSFQGFPDATLPEDINSPHVQSSVWGKGTAKGLSARELKSLCSQFMAPEDICIYEGWYKDTLRTISVERRFAFVHIDCDLFESTFDVLLHLFTQDLLSPGAMMLFDNWFCNMGSPEFGEQKAWQEINKRFDISFTDLGIYGIVGNRKIIHSYREKKD
jgi:predicted O-methyltransferase YrrM